MLEQMDPKTLVKWLIVAAIVRTHNAKAASKGEKPLTDHDKPAVRRRLDGRLTGDGFADER